MKEILLIGNPNTGKTTLFNTLTGASEHVGNWHGVTVGEKSKVFKINKEECKLTDLPGLYSLDVYSEEEQISYDYLVHSNNSIVVNICDANHIERNLLLSLQLLKLGVKPILAINMAKENKNIDYKKLQDILGVPVVPIDARRKKGVQSLLDTIKEHLSEKVTNQLTGAIEPLENLFGVVNSIISKVTKTRNTNNQLMSILDKIVLNKFLFLPIFVLVVSLVFIITFGTIGSTLSSAITKTFEMVFGKLLEGVENIFGAGIMYGLVGSAIFAGILSVLGFLPQVALLFMLLGILEDIGYLPRVAFMLDGLLQRVGLTGRALFSLLMGFGCTTSAVITTRSMDNASLKKRTAFILPFMSCSAKLPIFLVFASAFFGKAKVIGIICLYFLSIIMHIFKEIISYFYFFFWAQICNKFII